MVYVEPEIQEQIIKLHIAEGRTYKSLCDEFGLSYAVVKRIVTNYREHAKASEIRAKQLADMEELNRLKTEVAELRKENDFLKKRRRSSRRKASRQIPFHRQVQQKIRDELASG